MPERSLAEIQMLRIHKEFESLQAKLKAIAGESFLVDEKFVVSHPINDSLFLRLYSLSFVQGEPQPRGRAACLQLGR